MTEHSDLLTLIDMKMPHLSKGQKRIAEFLQENYGEAVHLTASKLGAIAGVSESTVVRFAIELGYDGYPKLQHALEELVKTKLTASERMKVAYQQMINNNNNILKSVLIRDAERIHATLNEVSKEDFDTAVNYILRARNVYIIGGRSSGALSYFLSFYLNLMRDNVKDVSRGTVAETFEEIFRVNENDLIIGISFPRYSTRTVKSLEFAHEKKAMTIAITDSKKSPLVECADITLAANSDMVSFVDSLVAPLSLINAILVAVSLNRKDHIVENLDILEKLWSEYQVYSSAIPRKYT
ncbi:MAG: MurR/RpiR family transcriptional regulator [Lachnospirales bacterium]